MPDDLEQELAQLIPLPPSSNLDANIKHSIGCHASGPNLGGQKHASCANANSLHPTLPRSLSDKILLSTLSLAAAAALVIITLLTTDYLNDPSTSAPFPNATTPTLANAPRLLAQLTYESNTDILPAPQSTQPRLNTQ